MKLEAKDISFSYPGRKEFSILEHFNLSISPGERVGLRGPSGRGKTTLCRLLAGYDDPEEGEVLLKGRPVREFRGACPVQMVWQHPETAVDPLLRLKKTMEEAPDVEKRVLDELYIEEAWMERYPRELSGGELQRFCLARALSPSTRFLLCDEISAMLDLAAQAQIWNFLLRESERRNLGMLVVSHSDALLKKVCTRITTLDQR
nr:ATP-binding cassette domain-containing protein [uncultured Mediterraneibacter sp.]